MSRANLLERHLKCDDNCHMTFWGRVKIEIINNHTTQEWIASKINKRPDVFSRWISKGTIPKADVVVEMARLLNTTAEYLVTGKELLREIDPLEKEFLYFFRPLPKYRKQILLDTAKGFTRANIDDPYLLHFEDMDDLKKSSG